MLVGRESERRVIDRLLAGARVGSSGVLVLSGEPGIGKTALLQDAETLVGDMRVLRAQGIESERSVPFAGLLQVLRPILPLLPHIPAPQRQALASALLLEPDQGTEPSRFAVGAATLSLLCRAAEDNSLAVFVDDAHLLDTPSVDAIVFAARRMVSDAVAMLVAVRARGELETSWSLLPTRTVEGLDRASAAELVAGEARGSGDANATALRGRITGLYAATAGNPLAILELYGGLVRSEPGESAETVRISPLPLSEQLTRSFMERVQGLGADAAAALVVAAADGRSLGAVHEALAVLGLRPGGLAMAEDAGLVTIRQSRVDFRHPLVRAAVYGSADAETRRAVHRAFAAVISPDEIDRLSWHLAQGATAPDETTAVTLAEVGERAARRGAHGIAADAHEQAAQLTGVPERRASRLATAAGSAWLAGLTERAVRLLDEALAADPEPLLRAHIQELRGAIETRCGSLDAGLATLIDAAREVERTDPDVAIRLLADAIHVCFYRADPAGAMRASDAIDRLTPMSVDARTASLGSMASGMALILSGSGRDGVQKVRAAAPFQATADERSTDRFRLPLRLQGALWLRSSAPERALVRESIEGMREQVALGSLPYLLMHLARDHATTDRWHDAEAAYLESIRLAGETGQSTDMAVSQAGLAWLYARQGRALECRELAVAAADLSRTNHIGLAGLWLDFAFGDLAAGVGDPLRAVGHYESLLTRLAADGLGDPDLSPAPELVEAYCHLGRESDARRVAEELDELARTKGEPWSLARAHRSLALCEPGIRGEERFRAALRLHEAGLDRFEQARTELAFGARLRRERRRSESRPLLRSALATFERLGAVPWANRAAQELRATGETVHRRSADALQDLTPQERQIAQLLAEGRTTREAAAALFLSPKTVEYHLRHVYQKLGIRSREALTRLFAV